MSLKGGPPSRIRMVGSNLGGSVDAGYATVRDGKKEACSLLW